MHKVIYLEVSQIINIIKLSSTTKNKLIKLKNKTGIENYNVLCRWAVCYSLQQNTIPVEIKQDEKVLEISWATFGGDYCDIYIDLIKIWCFKNKLNTDKDTIKKYFLLHLERGINYLTGTNFIKNIIDLINLLK